MSTRLEAGAAASKARERKSVVRGILSLVISQLLQMPLAMVANAVLARKLGPTDFGAIYLASTAVSLGFLFVEWGQQTTIAGEVARQPSRAEALLGTSLVSKLVMGGLATGVLALVGSQLGYGAEARTALLFLSAQAVLVTMQQSGSAVLRGHERTDIVSVLNLAVAVTGVVLTVGTALSGGGLRSVLVAMVAGSALMLLPTASLLRRNGVGRPRLDTAAARQLLGHGSAFLVLNIVLTLQPYVDAAMLARYTGPEVMGWYAASRRMTGLLIFPATTISFTLYPTLARLANESLERHVELMRAALRAMILASVPAAVGTVIFARPAVHLIYGTVGYEGAILNLQVLALWIVLVYFSIIFGNSLVALGRIKAWTAVQALCVVVSLVGDPPFIRLFQERLGNGAAGVSAASVVSELLMVGIGGLLLPRAILRGGLLRNGAQALAGGGAMLGVARLLSFSLPLSVAGALVAYVGVLFLLGAFRGQELRELVGMLRARANKSAVERAA